MDESILQKARELFPEVKTTMHPGHLQADMKILLTLMWWLSFLVSTFGFFYELRALAMAMAIAVGGGSSFDKFQCEDHKRSISNSEANVHKSFITHELQE